jgi:hypothetical protein
MRWFAAATIGLSGRAVAGATTAVYVETSHVVNTFDARFASITHDIQGTPRFKVAWPLPSDAR